jgi:hypothetical protein
MLARYLECWSWKAWWMVYSVPAQIWRWTDDALMCQGTSQRMTNWISHIIGTCGHVATASHRVPV